RNFEAARCEEWEAQVRAADVAVISKVDLADAAEIERACTAVRAIQPQARILRADDELPVGILLDAMEAGPRALALGEARAGRHAAFGVHTVGGTARYRLDPLEDWLEALPEAIFR